MPGLIVPQRWRQQPQGPSAADLSHPSARGLVTLGTVEGGAPMDVLNGVRLLPTGSPGYGISSMGVFARGNGSAGNVWSATIPTKAFASKTAGTILCVGRFSSAASLTDKRFVIIGHPVNGSVMYLSQGDGVVNCLSGFGVATGGVFMQARNNSAPSANVDYPLAYTRNGTSQRLWINGRDATTNTATPSSSAFRSDVQTITLGFNLNGGPFMWAAWDRELSESEIRALHENPWQLFRPIPARTWALMTGSGPTLVSATQDAAWSVRNNATASQGMAWSVRAAVGATQALAWSVLSAGTVTASQGLGWSVRNTVASSQGAAWSVRTLATGSQTSAWSVRMSVSATRSASWSVRNAVQATQGAAWRVFGYVAAGQVVGWAVGDVLPIERFAPRGGMRANAQTSTRPAVLSADRPDVIQRARRPLS